MAATLELALRVTVQAPVPLQAPDQPAKAEVGLAVADKVTAVPLGKLAVHVDPQLMPAGLLVMVPAPLPALWTVNWKFTSGGAALVVLDAQPHRANESNPRHKKKKILFMSILSGDRRMFSSK